MMMMIGLGVLLATSLGVLFYINQNLQPARTLLLGSGACAANFLGEYESSTSTPSLNSLGHVCLNECSCSLPHQLQDEAGQDLHRIARKLNVSKIVIAATQEEIGSWTQQLLDCKLNNIEIMDASMVSFSSAIETDQLNAEDKLIQPLG